MSTGDEKFNKLLIASVGHLVGLKSGHNGRLELATDLTAGKSRRIRDEVRVENINKSTAQQWQAGAVLESASELGILSGSKIANLRKRLKIGDKPKPTIDSRLIGTVVGTVNSRGNVESANVTKIQSGRHGLQSSGAPSRQNIPDRQLMSGHPSRFLPPRQVESSSYQNDFGGKSEWRGIETEPSSTNALFSSIPNKKPTLQHQQHRQPFPESNQLHPNLNVRNTMNATHMEPSGVAPAPAAFKTGLEALAAQDRMKGINRNLPPPTSSDNRPGMGLRKVTRQEPEKNSAPPPKKDENKSDNPEVNEIMAHESMKNIDPEMVEAILNEVVQIASTSWDDIAGLTEVKSIIREIIIWPLLRPDIFKGLRASPRGILFFGPPGTGKTMFGRLIASQSQSTFFNISASALTSKWIGDGEKMVRALFSVARVKQPSVIFIDEIDSILSQRSDSEHESSRRFKTEFLIQFDGCANQGEERVLVIGVTNRPQELDEAARRRFVKRVYIPLPDIEGRKQLVKNLLRQNVVNISEDDYNEIAELTAGYSGADMACVCREAAYGPIRDVGHLLENLHESQVRPMEMKDFSVALRQVKSSVAESDVDIYKKWDEQYGSHLGSNT